MVHATLSVQKLVCYVKVIVVQTQCSKWCTNSLENLHRTRVAFSPVLSHKDKPPWSHIMSSSPTQHGDSLMLEEYLLQVSFIIVKLIEEKQCFSFFFSFFCTTQKVTKT